MFRYVHARRVKLAGANAKVSGKPLTRSALRRFRAGKCYYCPRPATTVDHVVPLDRGGSHSEGNLVPACKSCNGSKGGKLLIEWRAYLIVKGRPLRLA